AIKRRQSNFFLSRLSCLSELFLTSILCMLIRDLTPRVITSKPICLLLLYCINCDYSSLDADNIFAKYKDEKVIDPIQKFLH
ncbi:hypothetical protein RhiirA5_445544, partial [Rhizophagus irregularis]